ncbi:hypothetical protein PMI08_05228 [Brevibacillus sp. CF112]|jgi:hypothetical protein|uniref:hypothetical protein n=1 Tax=Brevibacillus TaxID=55080 RepID=UPI000271A2A2|nr:MULTISPECIES: hypothetical protein [Brevibacillus]EJL38944.1 hypothetical protein PMI08_05228 [Brevibacillus sp. CF112]MBG9567442.1 hypothetical protein [Brevibacillus agri]MBY0054757.1 hypothetical protein [Brevibacillus agri]MDR9503408.1 hypothetical protein [Brevibacillus agri]
MAANKPQAETPEMPQLVSVEELQQRHATPSSVFVGVMAAQGWKPGKQVEEKEYVRAVADFLGSPISGKKVKPDA